MMLTSMLDLDLLHFVVVSLAIGMGAAIQGSFGYGMVLVAGPWLVLIEPRFIPGPVLLTSVLLGLLMTWRERQAVDLRGLKWAVVGRIVGTAMAGYILLLVSQELVTMAFGVAVLIAVVVSLAGVRIEPDRPRLLAAGLLSGLMGTIAAIGGPPLALIYQHGSPARLRSTLGGYLLLGSIMGLATLVLVGRFGLYELRLSLWLPPGLLLGFVLSSYLVPHLNPKHTRLSVLAIAAISGFLVIWQSFS
jgi:uncharacterized membrane protein YfcA